MPFTLYIAPRQSDKTRTCVSWLLGNLDNRAIITYNEMERRRILSILEEFGFSRRDMLEHVVTWEDRGLIRGRTIKEVCIDNLDLIISHMFSPHNIYAVTMSLENVIEPDSAQQT